MNNFPEELGAISNFFEIGSVEKVSRLGGIANDNFSVCTSKGRFVIKFVKEHSAENLKTVDPLFRALENHGFPATYYLRDPSGEFVFDNGNLVAVAMRNEAGVIPDVNEETLFVMGKTLALLHLVPIKPQEPRNTWFHPDFLPQGLTNMMSKADSENVDRFQIAWNQIEGFENATLRKSITHGDYHPGNVLFQDNELSTVLDWEEASFGYSIVDIAYTVFIICFKDSKFDVGLYSSFIHGYQSERRLLPDEWKSLSAFVRLVGLTVATWIALRYGANSSEPKIADLATRYWTAELTKWEPLVFD